METDKLFLLLPSPLHTHPACHSHWQSHHWKVLNVELLLNRFWPDAENTLSLLHFPLKIVEICQSLSVGSLPFSQTSFSKTPALPPPPCTDTQVVVAPSPRNTKTADLKIETHGRWTRPFRVLGFFAVTKTREIIQMFKRRRASPVCRNASHSRCLTTFPGDPSSSRLSDIGCCNRTPYKQHTSCVHLEDKTCQINHQKLAGLHISDTDHCDHHIVSNTRPHCRKLMTHDTNSKGKVHCFTHDRWPNHQNKIKLPLGNGQHQILS